MAEETGFTRKGHVIQEAEVVFTRGQVSDVVYAIAGGSVGLFIGETMLAELGAGAVIGAAGVLLERPQVFTVKGIASPASFTKEYDGHAFRHAFTVDPALTVQAIESLDREARILELHGIDATTDATARIAEVRALLKARAERVADLASSMER